MFGTNCAKPGATAWRNRIAAASFTIFDETAPIDMCAALDPKDVVAGRRRLMSSLGGFGAFPDCAGMNRDNQHHSLGHGLALFGDML